MKWLIAAKLLVTLALVAWLAGRVDWSVLAQLVQGAEPVWLTWAVVLQGTALFLANVRWWLLLRPLAEKVEFGPTQTPYWYGAFANNFFPAGLGADFARVATRFDAQLRRRDVLASVAIERVMALSSLLLLGGGALALRADLIGWSTSVGWLLVAATLAALVALGLPLPAERIWRALPGRSEIVEGLARGLDVIRAQRSSLFGALALSLVLQAMCIANFQLLGVALGATQPWWHYWLAVPVALLAAALPISFGGLGVREAAFVTLAASLGMDRDLAAAVSFLFVAELLVLTAPGVLLGLSLKRLGRS